MDRREILRRIAAFPIVTRDLAEDLLSGDFRSVFRGEGIEFDEVRIYEPGDDVRSIDRNVSARFGTPYVKMYREERELTVCIVLDVSPSMFTGVPKSRYEQGVLAAALLAFSAEWAGQRVGAVLFDREIKALFKPRKGRTHVMAIVSAALSAEPGGGGSGLGRALLGTGRLLKRRSLVVVISDFLNVNWERELGDLCRKNDVIALRIWDPVDTAMPDLGLFYLRDNETGLEIPAPSGSFPFRSGWTRWHEERGQLWKLICRRCGAAALELSTTEDPVPVLRRFFGRSRRNAGAYAGRSGGPSRRPLAGGRR
ncbi:MAG: DUF58 domain-containing protein [Spirochaetaceae bacterium]|jgi:uncharacterized protein (DUF58 family)|nr:DUF58 domain-containing protein [Spirochaetaceae bacterium]